MGNVRDKVPVYEVKVYKIEPYYYYDDGMMVLPPNHFSYTDVPNSLISPIEEEGRAGTR